MVLKWVKLNFMNSNNIPIIKILFKYVVYFFVDFESFY